GTDVEKFCTLLGKMPSLQTLFVDRVMLYNRTSMLMEFLEQAPLRNLRYIRLPHISSASHGVERMLALCKLSPGIQHWELMDSDIDDRALLTLTETCSRVRSLDLSRNEMITFKGFFDSIGSSHAHREQELIEDQDMLPLESRSDYYTVQDDPELDDVLDENKDSNMCQSLDLDNLNGLFKDYKHPAEADAVALLGGARAIEAPSSSSDPTALTTLSRRMRQSTSTLTFDGKEFQSHNPYSECCSPKNLQQQLSLQHQQQRCDTMPQESVSSSLVCKQSFDQEKVHNGSIHSQWQRQQQQQRRTSRYLHPQRHHQPLHLNDTGLTRCRSNQPDSQKKMYFSAFPSRRRRSICPTSRLLQNESPLEYLEELGLVFCLGIANTEFQTLFRALQGKSLRTLDLQFTSIEDSALETLANSFSFGNNKSSRSGGPLLTHVNLSYCNKITARGIMFLVERCPQLQELQFLSCDLVSAECFHGRVPWACTRLKRLEFTLQPRILFTVPNNHEETHSSGNQGQMDDMHHHEPFTFTQQYQDEECRTRDKACPHPPAKTESYEELLDSVQDDFHAMFRQLKRLDSLQALHIYNSPALNSFLSVNVGTAKARRRDSKMPAAWTQLSMPSMGASESVFQDLAPIVYSADVDGVALVNGETSSTFGRSRLDTVARGAVGSDSSPEKTVEDPCFGENGQASSSDMRHPLEQALVQDENPVTETPVVARVFSAQDPASIPALHPFSLQTGLGALRRLKRLQTLTLYERSNVSFGAAEARWITKSLPLLSSLELRGSIEIEAAVRTRLQEKRPQIQILVCSLF
ncbi:hypothetical protein BGW38_002731, partial [Lunasporangiospora selenospora]